MKPMLTALQFLTILPFGRRHEISEADLAKSVYAFTAVGLMQGLLLICSNYLLQKVFPLEIVMALVLLVLVLSNGGFHIDGLSDTFDALAKRGTKEEKLKVMKDGSAGAIGASAMVFSILIKYLSLKSLALRGLYPFSYYILLMPVLSKWTMVIAMSHGKPAREEGLGRIFIEGTGLKEAVISAISVLVFMAPALMLFQRSALSNIILFNAASLIALYVFGVLFAVFCRRIFGGLTGDTLGAVSELAEIIYLLMVTAWLRLYT